MGGFPDLATVNACLRVVRLILSHLPQYSTPTRRNRHLSINGGEKDRTFVLVRVLRNALRVRKVISNVDQVVLIQDVPNPTAISNVFGHPAVKVKYVLGSVSRNQDALLKDYPLRFRSAILYRDHRVKEQGGRIKLLFCNRYCQRNLVQ